MSNTLGNKIRCTVFGQSHSPSIGVVIDGLPAGFRPDIEAIEAFMARRRPGTSALTTSRSETDKPEIVSGLVDGVTCGSPLCALFQNRDFRSSDYSNLEKIPRPGHSDYTASIKYGGFNDIRGGGQFSGRLTAPLCFAGAICLQILETKGVSIFAHAQEIAGIHDKKADDLAFDEKLARVAGKAFPTIDDKAGAKMQDAILKASADKNSVGGIIECCVYGLDAGVGSPIFENVESEIAKAVFAVPAVKGIEFGRGFECAGLTGDRCNDQFVAVDGVVKTSTNNCGGILGGISNGMPVVFRCAVKPTPSISKPQTSVDLETGEETTLRIKGRHDPCIVPRAVPVIEAAAAIALINLM